MFRSAVPVHPATLILILIGLGLPVFGQEPARASLADASVRDGATERELTFAGHGGFELSGTLTLPAAAPAAGAPGLLLLPGSGPTDRDGNQPPLLKTDLLRSLAEHLADEGIATLRFDKRAAHVHKDHFLTLTVEQQNEFFSWDAFVGDARAGVEALRAADGVDPARVGVLGHSEGGLFAMQVGADLALTDTPLQVLVLAATPSEPMGQLIHDQVERQLQAFPEEMREKTLSQLDRAVTSVVETGAAPDDLFPGLQNLFPPSALALLQVELALEPKTLARGFPGPVLVLQGEHDVQVPAASAAALKAALDEREAGSCEAFVVPSASHNFKHVESQSDFGFQGEVVPDTLERLAGWLRETL